MGWAIEIAKSVLLKLNLQVRPVSNVERSWVFQTSNVTCAESNANENIYGFRSFALDSAYVKFDV